MPDQCAYNIYMYICTHTADCGANWADADCGANSAAGASPRLVETLKKVAVAASRVRRAVMLQRDKLVCSRMLTYAHVCSRMLTYADE
jgi:hypothetical protein